mmetsp:Transcript_5187/g.8776  ORF Transcript_5187/g.8776 Transcript_5187/m.8776 type:complete len:98 (+) Transcript_5187:50-343(+)
MLSPMTNRAVILASEFNKAGTMKQVTATTTVHSFHNLEGIQQVFLIFAYSANLRLALTVCAVHGNMLSRLLNSTHQQRNQAAYVQFKKVINGIHFCL